MEVHLSLNLVCEFWLRFSLGHYGPAFFSYFYDQNEAIKNGTAQGIPLQMDSLLIINGIIDEYIQAVSLLMKN